MSYSYIISHKSLPNIDQEKSLSKLPLPRLSFALRERSDNLGNFSNAISGILEIVNTASITPSYHIDEGVLCFFNNVFILDSKNNVWVLKDGSSTKILSNIDTLENVLCTPTLESDMLIVSWTGELIRFQLVDVKGVRFDVWEDVLHFAQADMNDTMILSHPRKSIMYIFESNNIHGYDLEKREWLMKSEVSPEDIWMISDDGLLLADKSLTDVPSQVLNFSKSEWHLVYLNSETQDLSNSPPLSLHADNVEDICSQATECWECSPLKGCTWCLALGECLPEEECRFTGYKDCCIIIPNCDTCMTFDSCVYCSGDKTGCFSGNSKGPTNETCSEWNYQSCPKKKTGTSPLVMGIVISIGSGVVVMSIILLFLLIRRLYWQRKARQAAIYFNPKLTCQWCQDGVAAVECNDCKLKLCAHCCESEEVHPPNIKHRITELALPESINHSSDFEDPSKEDEYTSDRKSVV